MWVHKGLNPLIFLIRNICILTEHIKSHSNAHDYRAYLENSGYELRQDKDAKGPGVFLVPDSLFQNINTLPVWDWSFLKAKNYASWASLLPQKTMLFFLNQGEEENRFIYPLLGVRNYFRSLTCIISFILTITKIVVLTVTFENKKCVAKSIQAYCPKWQNAWEANPWGRTCIWVSPKSVLAPMRWNSTCVLGVRIPWGFY